MDQAKKNAYWIAMGVLALGALVFWGVMVAGGLNGKIVKDTARLKTQVTQLQKFASIDDADVADPAKGLPVEPIVKYWDEKRKGLEGEKEEILKKYRARDKRFEELFGGATIAKVDYTSWVTEFRKRMASDLRGAYKDLLEQDDEATFSKAFPVKEPEDDNAKIVIAQKQFYMAKAIAESVKSVLADASKGTTPKRAQIIEMTFTSKEADPKSKADLERHDVTVDLRIPAPLAAALVSKLLQSWVVFELKEMKLETGLFTLPAFEPFKCFDEKAAGAPGSFGAAPTTPTMKNFSKDVYVATSDSSNPKTKNGPPALEEPAVGCKLSLAALDFALPEPAAEKK